MVWALLLSLAVHGYTGSVRQMLGSNHLHHTADTNAPTRPAFEPAGRLSSRLAGWLGALRSWQQDLHARNHALGLSTHGHWHGMFERHHHDIGDASVLAVDGGGTAGEGMSDSAGAASSGSTALPMTLGCDLTLKAPAAHLCRWPGAMTRTWQNAAARLPERPPRA
jgi:hypothetical protein